MVCCGHTATASSDSSLKYKENTPPFLSFGKNSGVFSWRQVPVRSASGLLTQAESLHDGTVTLDVVAFEVVEERTALTYQFNE